MTPIELAKLESEFSIVFPKYYRDRLIKGMTQESYEVECEYDILRESNLYPRSQKVYWSLPWKKHYWRIGGDGVGGFNIIDTFSDEDKVYYFDHEDCGETLDDHRVTTYELQEIVDNANNLHREIIEEEQLANDLREKRIKNRKWWQLWISKE